MTGTLLYQRKWQHYRGRRRVCWILGRDDILGSVVIKLRLTLNVTHTNLSYTAILKSASKRRTTGLPRIEQIPLLKSILCHPCRSFAILQARFVVEVRIPHVQQLSSGIVRRGTCCVVVNVLPLDHRVCTVCQCTLSEPERTAISNCFVKVKTYIHLVTLHPRRVIGTIDACVGIEIRIERVIVDDW